jgi:elongation factor 1-beta
MKTFEDEFAILGGDARKPHTAYGPEAAAESADADEDEIDLFGSDDEEESADAVRVREERLAEYNKKKATKTKPAAKSIVILDVKPWGIASFPCSSHMR